MAVSFVERSVTPRPYLRGSLSKVQLFAYVSSSCLYINHALHTAKQFMHSTQCVATVNFLTNHLC